MLFYYFLDGQQGHGIKPPTITIFEPLPMEETKEQASIINMPEQSTTTFKGQTFLWSQNAGLIFLTCSCTSKYSQDLQEHNSKLQLSEVIPMLC